MTNYKFGDIVLIDFIQSDGERKRRPALVILDIGDSTKVERDEFVKKMMERKSRTLMASGGNEPVADEGGSGHSVFADAFLKALKEADKGIFTAEELFHGRVQVLRVNLTRCLNIMI